MSSSDFPVSLPPSSRLLSSADFHRLADVPLVVEWFANIDSAQTRRAYRNALEDFMKFTGIEQPDEFREITRAHIIAWRDDLKYRELSGTTIRHRLAALSSLFEYLCDKNAVTHNPVKGIKRPSVEGYQGKTPAIGDHQARGLLESPKNVSLKGKRDRAILATLLYHALRREELCKLLVKDFKHERRGVAHLKVSGKGGKTRYIPLHPAAGGLILDYLEASGHGFDLAGALFRPIRNNRTGTLHTAITADMVYKLVRCVFCCAGIQDRGACATGDRGNQCAGSSGGYCQGAGMAGACEYCHDTDL